MLSKATATKTALMPLTFLQGAFLSRMSGLQAPTASPKAALGASQYSLVVRPMSMFFVERSPAVEGGAVNLVDVVDSFEAI